MGLIKNDTKTFASIVGGKIKVKCDKSNPEAIERILKLQDGKEGVKYELSYDSLEGMITGISFAEGQFGKQLLVTIDGIILAMSMKSNYADDMMKKLPNIDLTKSAKFSPYNFTGDDGKTKKGISIMQNDAKIAGAFYDVELKENLLGFPKLPAASKKWESDDWAVWFINVNKFLQKYTEENIIPKVPTDLINIEDINFDE